MPDTSPILDLPYLLPSQAQKHVTHNEALSQLDMLVQLVVETFDATVPPVGPAEGETHALGTGASGAWAGHDGELASWSGGAWRFIALQEGWRGFGRSTGELRIYRGGTWQLVRGETQNLDLLGVNASADATNRLAVSSPATLLSHEGAGHQLKINKAADTDTASLLFQTGWSGRAEMGLAGSDAFSIKVSADGAAWFTALTTDPATGYLGVGLNTTPPAALTVNESAAGEPIALRLQNNSGDASTIAADRGLVLSADHDDNTSTSKSYISLAVDAIEVMRIPATGAVSIGRAGGGEALEVNDLMRLMPRAAAPASPATGTIYFDSTTNKLRCWDGTLWQNLF